jgi:hypothetical protein
MTLIELGEKVAGRMESFATAARRRGMEPACFHVGSRQFTALLAWGRSLGLVEEDERVAGLVVGGFPVWRDDRLHHLELETICGSSTSYLERCLSL